MSNALQPGKGKVILAGAGPGDPELLTLKALGWLRKAEVVITDRLVSDTILEAYTNPHALVLHVGKECSKGASTPQSTINELLVEYALQGKLVIRLKGGDVSLFSNVLDELQALTAHHIDYEIVPGVTAALGAAAYAGMPLTARGYSTAVRFLTCYRPETMDDAYWKDLARTDDTLVFYMSSAPLDELVRQLIRHGITGDKWLAIIEQATTPGQHIKTLPIHEYAGKGHDAHISPTLIIIGRVVALHESFRWLPEKDGRDPYFKSVGQAIDQTERA